VHVVEPSAWDGVDPEAPTQRRPQVEIALSVKEDLLVLARLSVSTLASRAGFDIEEIDDLRLAVDELCLLVLQGRRSGRLIVTISAGYGQIDVWCNYDGADEPNEESGDDGTPIGLSTCILDALVDEHGPAMRAGLPGEHMCKRSTRTDG
jgi:serine/threonine-protein kinase RsbW